MRRYFKLFAMARLLLAQDALLPPEFADRASKRVKLLRRVLILGAPRFSENGRGKALSDRIRKLGPTYIKIGQFLATRPDIVGQALAADLRHLQDRLPPFASAEVVRALKQSPDPLDQILTLDKDAIAAASIAQVHKGRRRDETDGKNDGETAELAVKILRPNIESVLARELSALFTMARLAERFIPASRRLRPYESVSILAKTVAQETDLRLEAAAQAEIGENFSGAKTDPTRENLRFRVPKIYWQATRRRVLAMDWVDAIPAGDLPALDAAGIDRKDLAVRLIRIFLTQALHDGFFHADMHQGNVLVEPDGTLVAIDFGIVGRLDHDSRRFLAEILHGFIVRDYARVARIHIEAGYVPNTHNEMAFAQNLRAVVEPIRDLKAGDIPMSHLLAQLFDVTARFDMATQPQLLLLQKTMVMVEGLARDFDPALNFWDASAPVISAWIGKHYSLQALRSEARDALVNIRQLARALPNVLPKQAETDALLRSIETRAHRAERRAIFALRLVALAIACALIYACFLHIDFVN